MKKGTYARWLTLWRSILLSMFSKLNFDTIDRVIYVQGSGAFSIMLYFGDLTPQKVKKCMLTTTP